MRNFVNGRVIGGVQQIKAYIDFHTYSELVLWPYGYTRADTGPGAHAGRPATRSRRWARAWPATNGYTPEQSSDLYITDGAMDDWLWGEHKIFAYTFEMYPRRAGEPGLLPARRADRPRDEPQPRGRPADARGRRLPVRP